MFDDPDFKKLLAQREVNFKRIEAALDNFKKTTSLPPSNVVPIGSGRSRRSSSSSSSSSGTISDFLGEEENVEEYPENVEDVILKAGAKSESELESELKAADTRVSIDLVASSSGPTFVPLQGSSSSGLIISSIADGAGRGSGPLLFSQPPYIDLEAKVLAVVRVVVKDKCEAPETIVFENVDGSPMVRVARVVLKKEYQEQNFVCLIKDGLLSISTDVGVSDLAMAVEVAFGVLQKYPPNTKTLTLFADNESELLVLFQKVQEKNESISKDEQKISLQDLNFNYKGDILSVESKLYKSMLAESKPSSPSFKV